MSLNIGDKIPDFSLVNYDKESFKSEDFLGKKTMFVFMPFPFSSVCDGEICELRAVSYTHLTLPTNHPV